jgi:hypothetical protein
MRTITMGSQFGIDMRSKDDNGNPFPPADDTSPAAVEMWIDGGSWRHDRKGVLWVSNAEKFGELYRVELFDGDVQTSYWGTDESEESLHKIGFLSGKVATATRNPPIWPVFNTFRAADRALGDFSEGQWAVQPDREAVNGHECIVLTWSATPTSLVTIHPSSVAVRCWVDPSQGFCILRRSIAKQGKVRSQIDVIYDEHDVAGWVPIRWTWVLNRLADPPSVEETCTGVLTDVRINEAIDPKVFRFAFPKGTDVQDSRGVKGDRDVASARYLVGDEGITRPVTKAESSRNTPYVVLASTSPSGVLERHAPGIVQTVLRVISAIALAGAATYLVRRQVIKRTGGAPPPE